MIVRTRIAPSPTGDPHVGTAYIALFNWCFARQKSGQFILRIEDTDQVRSHPASEEKIFEALRWLGLEWDEGPDIGGPFGPYRQSERSSIYREYAQQLVNSGHAFYCFRSAEELEMIREQRRQEGLPPGFKIKNPQLTEAEVQQRLANNETYVIRLNVPDAGVCTVLDQLRGPIEIDWSQVDMQILLKSDGLPTYHLANVVDDHLMEITHVIRGEEWINSTPKHLLLYQYFGWQAPSFYHLPLLRNPDKSKLSKRKNPTSILYYQRMGYLAEAVLNYLGRMGWSMPDEREQFSLTDMLAEFDISRVSTGGPIFDVEKLDWLNGEWLRGLSEDEFISELKKWALNESYLRPLLPHVQKRVEKFSDVVPLMQFSLAGELNLTKCDFQATGLPEETTRKILQFTLWACEQEPTWDKSIVEKICISLSQALALKLKFFMPPLFVAITGKKESVSVMDAMAIIGSDMTRARLRQALESVGAPSKKETKEWQKEFSEVSL